MQSMQLVRSAFLVVFFVVSILVLFLPSVSMATWSWSSYIGTVNWHVAVTEDETGCDGGISTSYDTFPIEYNAAHTLVTDLHGTTSATFTSDNVLHVPGRTVSDGPGQSRVSDYDIFFTTDCSSFTARYTWDYSGPDGSCSGSTRLAGTNSGGCPSLPTGSCQSSLDCNTTSTCVDGVCVPTQTKGVCTSDSDCNSGHKCVNGICVSAPPPSPPPSPLATKIASARKQLNDDLKLRQELGILMRELMRSYGYHKNPIEQSYYDMVRREYPALITNKLAEINAAETLIEASYLGILKDDPDNFWANWDMAQLRKSQGNMEVATEYLTTALDGMTDSQRDEVKNDFQSAQGFQTPPTSSSSKVEQQLSTETKELKSVFGMDVTKLTPNQSDRVKVALLLIALFDKDGDIINPDYIKYK